MILLILVLCFIGVVEFLISEASGFEDNDNSGLMDDLNEEEKL